MVDLTHKQQEALEHPIRKKIYDFLQGYDKPASLGEIGEGIGLSDLAKVHLQLHKLVDVDLVEKVTGTNRYWVAGASR